MLRLQLRRSKLISDTLHDLFDGGCLAVRALAGDEFGLWTNARNPNDPREIGTHQQLVRSTTNLVKARQMQRHECVPEWNARRQDQPDLHREDQAAVSYTHLTLPTKLEV